MDNKTLVNKVLAEIKARISADKKKRTDQPSWSVEVCVADCRENGKEYHTIKVGGFWSKSEYGKLSRYEVNSVAYDLIKGLKEMTTTRGWKNLNFTIEEILPEHHGWSTSYVKFPTNICLLAEPCKEFKSLANYIEKYCGRKITPTDIYSVHIGGKRGYVYGEEGERYYLCHKPKKCASLLESLRKARGAKDNVSVKPFKEVDEVDPWELECSIRNEVEFDGVRHRRCEIVFTTPTGKRKLVVIG